MILSYCENCSKITEHAKYEVNIGVFYICMMCFDIRKEILTEIPLTMAATSTTGPICHHKNGLYNRVTFGPFARTVYVCVDCGQVLYGKELKTWERGRA